MNENFCISTVKDARLYIKRLELIEADLSHLCHTWGFESLLDVMGFVIDDDGYIDESSIKLKDDALLMPLKAWLYSVIGRDSQADCGDNYSVPATKRSGRKRLIHWNVVLDWAWSVSPRLINSRVNGFSDYHGLIYSSMTVGQNHRAVINMIGANAGKWGDLKSRLLCHLMRYFDFSIVISDDVGGRWLGMIILSTVKSVFPLSSSMSFREWLYCGGGLSGMIAMQDFYDDVIRLGKNRGKEIDIGLTLDETVLVHPLPYFVYCFDTVSEFRASIEADNSLWDDLKFLKGR